MPEERDPQRLWAPWRAAYVKGMTDAAEGGACFLCRARDGRDDAAGLVLARGPEAFVVMNRYPYNPGHLMIASNAHVGGLEEISPAVSAAMWRWLVVAKAVLREAMRPHGFNIGINQGRPAGAGLLDHLHIHIVPRWSGDTNFLPVLDGARVISQALEDLYRDLRPRFQDASRARPGEAP
ncbi:MAG: HIT domain-containing protein [Planctomycetota bacterium]